MTISLLALAGSTPAFFTEVAVLLVSGAAIAYLGSRLRLLPIVGFLMAGVVIGPNALGLVKNRELVDAAAEVGVVLLLFTIGIEFSFEKLNRIRRLIFGAGGLQVALATGVTAGLLALFGVGWRAGVFTGFLVALSSTAIVLKLLGERGETSAEHGQVALGLLIFQDLAIIPMVLMVPMLGGQGGPPQEIAFALLRAAGIIAVVLLVARRVMPRLLDIVARTCSPELFLLTVVAVCFGTAYLTSLAGVSLSLGAFLAGLLVSESRFSEHALGEILPLQILFSATFFVSVGMLTDLGFLARHPLLVAAVVAVVLAVKFITTAAGVRALGYRLPVAAASGLVLAQVGEFSFVLERAGREAGLTPMGMGETGSQAFIATTVLLMILTPLLAALGTRLSGRMAAHEVAMAQARTPEDLDASHLPHLEDHVVVAGYGEAARTLARVLHGTGVPYVITTLNPQGASDAEAQGYPVLRGDSTRSRTLQLVGTERARVMVIADDEPVMAHRITTVARSLNPSLHIVVRTRYAVDAETLMAAGADTVVTEETEAVVRLSSGVLRQMDLPFSEVEAQEDLVRRSAASPAPAAATTTHATLPDPEQVVTFAPAEPSRCTHLAQVRPVHPSARGCEDCLRIGSGWTHLRICMTCGHVGCCDSSPNRHASAHFQQTHHPVMRSAEPGESWGWCYEDSLTL
ncbi:MAG TPA: cation:proton antiporter [Longimicrobium sp.]